MMRPQPVFVMRRAASRASWKTARTFRLYCLSNDSSVASTSGAKSPVPALLTRMSRRPVNLPPKAPSSCAMSAGGPS